ncbi:hypothetical protein OS493_012269 [Desmophyllum pertusum]|uniref:Uncharacterized protein n=1 Tax=Desmophyllum pertusum TaxID=174260 RepID=A0A9W9ZQH2_9CNID|nr:hypothetical protein OS493_012269 [Desmophyllum pertusum]
MIENSGVFVLLFDQSGWTMTGLAIVCIGVCFTVKGGAAGFSVAVGDWCELGVIVNVTFVWALVSELDVFSNPVAALGVELLTTESNCDCKYSSIQP